LSDGIALPQDIKDKMQDKWQNWHQNFLMINQDIKEEMYVFLYDIKDVN
jgi:hypothetical protein